MGDDPYQNHPITRRREIRLLQVLPDLSAAIIKCKFKSAVLHEQPWMPHFTAISYTWGSAVRDESIMLYGRLYNITSSAHQALTRVRRQDKPVLIWIDSICINQDDTEEKSKQIQLMGQIYSMASHTVGWIGEADEDSVLAINSMKDMVKEFGYGHPCRLDASLGDALLKHALSEAGSRELKAIAKLLSRAWFHRIWVLQEVALSRRLIIYCGEEEFLWGDVHLFVLSIPHVKSTLRHQLGLGNCLGPVGTMIKMRLLCQFEKGLESKEMAATLPRLREMNHLLLYAVRFFAARSSAKRTLELRSRSLTSLLNTCAHFGATDPRDQIYGLLNLVVESSGSGLIPDYSQSVEEVYCNVTKHIISTTQSLEVLQRAGTGMVKRREGLPSWVPDFAKLIHGPKAQDDQVPFQAGISPFTGTGVPYQFFVNKVSFQGAVADRIKHIGSVPFLAKNRWYEWLIEAQKLANATYLSDDATAHDVLWRTLMGNHHYAPGGSTYPAPIAYRTAFRHFQTLYLNPKFIGLQLEQVTAQLEKDSAIPPEHKQQATLFLEQSWDRIKDRHFATTARNDMAIVHPGTKVGDSICLILGSKVPFVIRQRHNESNSENGEFELVGECYAHSLMDGQGLKFAALRRIILI